MPQTSPAPTRYPNGVSTDHPWGPLACLGAPHPFLYHHWHDDFDQLASEYTATKSGAGTIASAAGDGGLILFTTGALAADICSVQMPAAGFARAAIQAGKKMFFMARLKLGEVTNTAFIAGLIQKTATPFTVTDGIYFYKATGAANNLVLRHTVGSANEDLVIPTSAYTLAADTFIDLGWYMDRNGEIFAFVSQDFLNKPSTEAKGSCESFTPAAITTAALTPTLAVAAITASAKTMTVDFAMAAKER